MELQKLTLHNFKGLRNYEVEPRGKSINIYGANATGKTSIADAVAFLLFDKDTQDRTPQKFGIKTLDEHGQPIHGAEHSVEGIFLLENGDSFTLRKVYTENWTKRRGSTESNLTGHTTSYYIDEEPISQKEYKERVGEIMDEGLFKMLTLPHYLAETMHWKERRDVLTEIAGDIHDEDIIEGNAQLSGYSELLDGKSEEARQKILKERKKKLNKEIDNIPSRIDELTGLMKDVEGVEDARKTIESLKQQKVAKEEERSQVRAGGGVAELNVKVQQIEAEKAAFVNRFQEQVNETLKDTRQKVSDLEGKVDESEQELREATRAYTSAKSDVEQAEEEAGAISKDIEAEQAKQPDPKPESSDGSEVCPYCEQEMPQKEGDHEDHYEQYLKDFNSKKAATLRELKEKFAAGQERVNELYVTLTSKETAGAKARGKNNQRKEALAKAQTELRSKKEATPSAESQQPYKDLETSKQALLDKIAGIKEERQSMMSALDNEVAGIEQQIETHQAVIHQAESNRTYQARIQELRDMQKRYAKELEEVEEALNLIDEFTRARAEFITDKVNSKFKLVKWRLFKDQINGGVEPCADPMVNGVPYSEGLNNAARVQAGIDIIETLSNHYEKTAPVFIDNRESVTELPATDLQVISLIVSPSDKKLRVEVSQEMAAA